MLCAATIDNHRLGVAFGWAQVQPGVFAIDNPFTITSNALILDPNGAVLPPSHQVAELMRLLVDAPWYAELLQAHSSSPSSFH